MGCGISRDGKSSYKPVYIDNFKINEVVGKGTFGKVCIVERKTDRKLFALKYSSKEKALHDKAVSHIIQERNMLEEIRHSFICGLRYSFQDEEYLYMVLDLMRGGDLRFHIKSRALTETESRLIVAEISCALKYLHALSIVHRDIKPDNILMDEQGHSYLTDFNVAIRFIEGKPLKSVAGTEPYMAPEIIVGAGYYSAVDWWSLGVMVFELVCGERPFRSKMRRELIKRAKYKFPESAIGLADSCRSLISGFIQLDPRKRLGYGPDGLALLHNHPFFAGLSWSKVECKAIAPVFVPSRVEPNFKTDANSDDLVQFVSKPRRPMKDKMLVGSVFQDFSYFDYTLFRDRTLIAYLSSSSLRSVHADTNEFDSPDRINTSFDTTNSSGMSKLVTLASQLSVKRRNSKSTGFARRRHSTASHRQREVLPGNANGATLDESGAYTSGQFPSFQFVGSPPVATSAASGGSVGTGNAYFVPPSQTNNSRMSHLSPLMHLQGGGRNSEGWESSSNPRRRHTINVQWLDDANPDGSKAGGRLEAVAGSRSNNLMAGKDGGGSRGNIDAVVSNTTGTTNAHGVPIATQYGKSENSNGLRSSALNPSNSSLNPQKNNVGGSKQIRINVSDSSSRSGLNNGHGSKLHAGTSEERHSNNNIPNSTMGSNSGIKQQSGSYLVAGLAKREGSQRRHSYNAPQSKTSGQDDRKPIAEFQPAAATSAISLQPRVNVIPPPIKTPIAAVDSTSGSSRISGKSSSILAGSQARLQQSDSTHSKDLR